jgi:hypothetical protein
MIRGGHNDQYAADLLVMQYGVYDLRDIASELGVSRKRGDSKRETAERIVAQAPAALSVREGEHGAEEVAVDTLAVPSRGRRAECRGCGGLLLDRASGGGSVCIDCGLTSSKTARPDYDE